MATALWILIFSIGAVSLFYHYASLRVWSLALSLYLIFYTFLSYTSGIFLGFWWLILLSAILILNIKPWRQQLLSKPVFNFYKRIMPSMSATEKEAIQAGTVSWEAEIFTGAPNWYKFLNLPVSQLSSEEQAFIDGPVEALCNMIDDWEITHHLMDLPSTIWDFIKKQGFMGLIIPKKYGGKEFSAWAHAVILFKVYSRSITVATSISVPNSLGPAELILKYGTDTQKSYYLPRLAAGEEIPCFALTGPTAGSDAAAVPDTGVVMEGEFEGHKTLGVLLNWNKRYITLAPVATVLGLAFRLYDPDHLLGSQTNLGISCALIPTNTPGISIGRRHYPMNIVFMNGPTQGHNVFIPLDWLIGGKERAGQGWQMLMECLAVGRGISLPSSAVGGAKSAIFTTSAYARIRKQFNMSIGFFEGIREVMARMIARAYIVESSVHFIASAIDQGEKPSVASAIVKYHTTEMARQIVNDALDVHAGKGICLGPNNYLARGYEGTPISITVEGANILTRCLIIFGQGVIRCHPHILAELEAAQAGNLESFDTVLFSHIGDTISQGVRSLFLALTHGYLVRVPRSRARRYYQLITRYSAAFAWITEVSILMLGGDLKRRESLSARLGDVLSTLYLASAVLKRYHSDGEPESDYPIVEYACQELLVKTQTALEGIIHNFPHRGMAMIMRVMVVLRGSLLPPSDKLAYTVSELFYSQTETRTRLTQYVHKSLVPHNLLAEVEEAFRLLLLAEPHEKQLAKAIRAKKISGTTLEEQCREALDMGLLNNEEITAIKAAAQASQKIIAVDDFADAEEMRGGGSAILSAHKRKMESEFK